MPPTRRGRGQWHSRGMWRTRYITFFYEQAPSARFEKLVGTLAHNTRRICDTAVPVHTSYMALSTTRICCPAVLLCCPVHGSKHPKPMCTYGDHAAQHVTDGGRSRAGLRPYDFLNDFLGAVMSCHVSSLRLAGYREMIFCVASALEFAMVRKELRRH